MASLTAIQTLIGEINVEKGWRSLERRPAEILALVHSEVSEALEEIRNGHEPTDIYFGDKGKPEGYLVELADAVIRILDEFDFHGVDAEKVIQMKVDYNATRPHLHGGKTL